MKKVLFATTALVASAGMAAADAHTGVSLSGSAEIGIVGGSRYADEVQFHSDIDVKFSLSGETDNGLTFGATIDLDEVGDDCTPGRSETSLGTDLDGDAVLESGVSLCVGGDPISENFNNGTEELSVFISGNFGTITMGDTDGAFDWALQELDVIGDINDSNTSHAGFNGNSGLDGRYDGQVARYDYSFGDFAFAVSAEIDDTGAGDPAFGIGGKYSGDLGGVNLGVGLGYQSDGTNDIIGISLDAQFDNGIRGILNYSDLDGLGGRDSHWGLGVFYSMDALSMGINYGVYDNTVGPDSEGFGLAVNYDLGGGAVVAFGYGSGETGPGTDRDTFSLGVSMSF